MPIFTCTYSRPEMLEESARGYTSSEMHRNESQWTDIDDMQSVYRGSKNLLFDDHLQTAELSFIATTAPDHRSKRILRVRGERCDVAMMERGQESQDRPTHGPPLSPRPRLSPSHSHVRLELPGNGRRHSVRESLFLFSRAIGGARSQPQATPPSYLHLHLAS